MSWIKKDGNTNVKSLNRVLGRNVQGLCTVESSPPAYGILQEECGTILPLESQSTHTCLMEVENAVSGVIPKYPINAQLGSNLMTEKAMTYG